MSNFPITKSKHLTNDIEAHTKVSLISGMQVASVTFRNSSGDLGQVQLSPVETVRTGIELGISKQKLNIIEISFRAAFGLSSGQVSVRGNATNDKGTDIKEFSTEIASWSAN